MIKVNLIGEKEIVINADMIERIESMPETIITMINNKKIIVLDTSDQIIEKVIAYKHRIIQGVGGE